MTAGWGRVARAWNRFWFASTGGLRLGMVRMAVAASGLVLWVGTLPLIRYFYTDAGEFPIAAARSWSVEYVARFLMPDWLGSFPAVAVLFGLWGLALALLLVGRWTRTAAWANWLLTMWFFFRNPTFANGGDEVFRLASLYLAMAYTAVAPSRRSLSLDRAAAGMDAPGGTVPAWTLRMIQIQICLVYVVAGFWKVVGAPWWDGTAIQYALGNSAFSRFGAPDWAWIEPLFVGAAVAIAWWELLFPLLVMGRRTRVPALVFGVALHAGILLFMNIGVFPFIMLACYPAFLTEEEARRMVERIRSRVGLQARASATTETAAGLSA